MDILDKEYRVKLIKRDLAHPFVFDEIYRQFYGNKKLYYNCVNNLHQCELIELH